ncbi:MAG: hypothetical protein RR661_01320, partial [Anaerovoracaceae bacterium]
MSKNKTKPKSVTKPAAKAKPKALIFLVVLLPIILTALAFVRIYLNQENAEKQGNEAKPGSAVTEEASPKEWTAAELNRIKEIPGEYFKEGKQPGTLTEITY